jgi:hypothetical protein
VCAAGLCAESRQVGRGCRVSCEGDPGFCAPPGLRDGAFVVPLLIDIVERERETQAARVLAGLGVT